MKIAGIDIGTTSVCGIILNTETGTIEKSVTRNSDAFIPGCKPYEKMQSVEKIMEKAMEIVHSFLDCGIDAIGVTGQMHGIVYTDAGGNAISPLYTWQDERGNLPYKDTTYAGYLDSCTGYGAVTDFYNRENGIRPENAVSYCTIHDYLVMKLCNLKTPIIHNTDYASFGKGADVGNAQVVSDFALAGSYGSIPVAVAIGDNQASVFSTLKGDSVLVNVGTGSQVSVVSDTPVTNPMVETRPYFDGKYLLVGAALCGGRAYALLKNFYAEVLSYVIPSEEDMVYSIMNRMLSKNKAPLSVDTRFAGTRWDKNITGSVTGITEGNFTPESLTAGVIRGMADELYNMYLAMNTSKNGLVGSGNGIRKNPELVKVTEEIFGHKLKTPIHTEEAACGAALFAGVATGIFENSNAAQSIIKYEE